MIQRRDEKVLELGRGRHIMFPVGLFMVWLVCLASAAADESADAPVVFCSVSGYKPEMRSWLQLTGLIESIDIRATLETALCLHPPTREIAVIIDSRRTGRALHKKTEEAL